MKPAFALDFRNDAIALLHRTSGGWHQIGRVAIDEPDLAAALSYLRATALGLSPRGLATKLILPDDQILLTTVDAPGPDDAARAEQIRAALEGRTPYPVEDLVFDWEVSGGDVRVAVVARDTLDEAESFAAEHRFNPVAFAAAPEAGFDGEAWFGMTAQAAELLAPGETVERDGEQVLIVARGGPIEPEPKVLPEPEPEPASAEAAGSPEPAAEAELFGAPAEVPFPQGGEIPYPAEPDAPAAVEPAPESRDESPAEPVDLPEPDAPDLNPPEPDAPEPAPLPAEAAQPFGQAEDEPPPSVAVRGAAEPAARPNGAAHDEAPMALDVEDDDGATPAPAAAKPAPADDVPPMPGFSAAMGFASRRASADAGQSAKLPPPPPRPMVDRPTAAKPLVTPPAPKAERPVLNRPTAARPLVQPEGKGLRGLGALVTAPGLPGAKKKKVAAPATAPQPGPVAPAAADRVLGTEDARGLARGLGGRAVPVRGKPRFLGLILTVLLLLALALIAAWSTSLAFRSDSASEIEQAANLPEDTPAVEDEMLADGQDPEAQAEEELALAEAPAETAPPPEDTAAAEPAPSAATDDSAPAPAAPAPGAASGDEIFLAAKDQAPVAPGPLALPEVAALGDPLPSAQAPPPPYGTVYKFDANGLIVPTPEGIVTPEGVRLVAGKPPVLPKTRPAELVPPPADPALAATPALPEAAETPFVSDPALSGFRPKSRPEGLAPPPAADAPEDDAALAPVTDNRLAGKRPQARPETVLAAGEALRAAEASAAASLAAQDEADTTTSKLAVAISRKPEPRPQDLSRAVEAAVAAAMRSPAPVPEAEPEQVAAVIPEKSPQPRAKPEDSEPTGKSGVSAAPRGKDGEIEADQEPELEASAPRGTQSGSVAKQATFKNALNLEKTALIGVYGTPSKRYAMIRTSNGRYKKVKVGDSIDGGRVQAITANEVRYQKGSKLMTLSLPKG